MEGCHSVWNSPLIWLKYANNWRAKGVTDLVDSKWTTGVSAMFQNHPDLENVSGKRRSLASVLERQSTAYLDLPQRALRGTFSPASDILIIRRSGHSKKPINRRVATQNPSFGRLLDGETCGTSFSAIWSWWTCCNTKHLSSGSQLTNVMIDVVITCQPHFINSIYISILQVIEPNADNNLNAKWSSARDTDSCVIVSWEWAWPNQLHLAD